MFEETCQGLVCLMIASKVQDSDLHLKVENVVQLLLKLLEDNKGMAHPGFTNLHKGLGSEEHLYGSRRLQNIALLARVAGQEKSTIRALNFHLNVATPAEFIVVYLQMFESKVTQIDWETIMMLRGQSLSNSYICLHVAECVLLGAQAIALACILNVMLDWQWSEVADSFIDLMSTAAPDACSLEDVIVCQHRLQEIICRETMPNATTSDADTEEDFEEEGERRILTTVPEASDLTESAVMINDRIIARCSCRDLNGRLPCCSVHGEIGHGTQNFSELADQTTLIVLHRLTDA